MTAKGRITSTRLAEGDRIRVQPITYGAPGNERASFVPARNLRDSVPAVVIGARRDDSVKLRGGRQVRIVLDVRTEDGRTLSGHFALAETQRLV